MMSALSGPARSRLNWDAPFSPTCSVRCLYIAAFAIGKIGVFQCLVSQPDQYGANSLPLTCSDLYQEPRDFVDTGGLP